MTGVELIAQERERQVVAEGWTPEHDDQHDMNQLAMAASCYALPQRRRRYAGMESVPTDWPWSQAWWKPSGDDRVRELVKSGALIAAEIDRLQRVAA